MSDRVMGVPLGRLCQVAAVRARMCWGQGPNARLECRPTGQPAMVDLRDVFNAIRQQGGIG